MKGLWRAFVEFFNFSPWRLSLCFLLMLFQGLSSGLGLLFIVPLLHLIGIDFSGGYDAGFADIVGRFFTDSGVELTLPIVLFAYILIISSIAAAQFYLSVLNVGIQQAYVRDMRMRLYRALLHSNWQFVIGHKMSDFVHSLSTQVQVIGQSSQQMLNLLSHLSLAAVYVGLALILSWQMCLLALICGLFLLVILIPLNKRTLRSGERQLGGHKAIFQLLTEQLSSLKMIKSYAAEGFYADKLESVSCLLEEQQVRITRISAFTQFVYAVGAVLSFSIFFYFALEWINVSLPTLLLLLLIFSRLLPRFSSMQSTYQRILHQVPAFEDVRKMMAQCITAKEADQGASSAMPILNRCIRLDKVSFQYQGKNRRVIENLSLEIKHNQSVALVGPSGVGKSTVADIIAGLLQPTEGAVYCDDIKLEGISRMAWRQGLAYITQDVFLFHDTVRANLEWVSSTVGVDDLWQALELAAAKEFVEQLPLGLDTVIGDRGVRLSGGERQRLALARALLSQPQLLILDEATSALDYDNEIKVRQALRKLKGKLTIIIIAHRETTIEHVDSTISLKIN